MWWIILWENGSAEGEVPLITLRVLSSIFKGDFPPSKVLLLMKSRGQGASGFLFKSSNIVSSILKPFSAAVICVYAFFSMWNIPLPSNISHLCRYLIWFSFPLETGKIQVSKSSFFWCYSGQNKPCSAKCIDCTVTSKPTWKVGAPLVQMMLLLYMLTPDISNDFRIIYKLFPFLHVQNIRYIHVDGRSRLGSFPSCARLGPWGTAHYFVVFHWVEAAKKHSKCAEHI